MKTFDPRYILCFLIAWMITNGWAYIFLGIGILFHWKIFTTISSAPALFSSLICLLMSCLSPFVLQRE
ncbi:MAG: hypothetical protein IIZ33_03375 [Erysipelotrichaceae bacterium]|nr:hypothetical protein [Erysipelotrichaceae bacterium]